MKITKVKVLPIPVGERQKTAHMYFFPQGESIMEQFVNRRNRPVSEFRALLPKVFEQTDFADLWNEGHIEPTWSQKCGCSCGCSPGFRLKGLYGKNIFVDVQ